MSPEDEAIGMVASDGFRLQESSPAPLGKSVVKHGVLVRPIMDGGWFGGLITRKSQGRTKEVDYTTTVCVLKNTKACVA